MDLLDVDVAARGTNAKERLDMAKIRQRDRIQDFMLIE